MLSKHTTNTLPSRSQQNRSTPPQHSCQALPEHQLLYPYGIGIDTHSKFIQVCVLFQKGSKILRSEKEFPTDWQSLKSAHAWAMKGLPIHEDATKLRYCIESTGCYHMPILRAWGGVPSVVNPLLAGPSRRKTDVLDAQMLATHSITGVWKASFLPTQQAQELRILWAQRREAQRMATRASNRINNIILRFGHTLGASASMRSATAEGILSDLIEGEVPDVPEICPDGLPESVRPVIKDLLTQLYESTRLVKHTEKFVTQWISARQWPTGRDALAGDALLDIFSTVPGVGSTTAIMWLAEVCDPRRFQNAKQVAAFAGCDPSLKVSAGKVTSHTRRAGNLRLHNALNFAAQRVLIDKKTPMGQWGRSIIGRHKKGGFRKAQGAVARRIACALWHVHMRVEAYNPAGYNFQSMPLVEKTSVINVVNKRAALLLTAEGISNTQQLSDAFHTGKLALIPGIGQTTLDAIKAWITSHLLIAPKQDKDLASGSLSKRSYALDASKTFVKKVKIKESK